jgi:cobalamin-dependent methionine synthase I
MIITYDIHELVPYINWVYFFFAWQVKNEDEKACLRQEAEMLLTQWEGRYHAYGLFELFEANADGDDIVVRRQESGFRRIPCLQ